MKSFSAWALMGLIGAAPMLPAQTLVDLRTQGKSIDFSAASSTKPFQTGATLPGACAVGAAYFNTAAPAGKNLYGCTSTNTWTLLGSSLLFGGGAVSAGNCAQFDSSGNIVAASGPCGAATAVTMASPFAAAGALLVSAGSGRVGVASSCTNSGGTMTCPGGFVGYVTWPAGSGSNTRQILAPAGAFTNSFNYVWADAVPSAATLMKIGTPSAGAATLGPAIPDTDYVTPSGTGTLQNKTFDGSSIFSSYLPWAQISTPAAPAAGYLRVYAKSGVGVCWMNSSGTETCGGAGLSDPGSSGMVVETSPGVTTDRTITAGSSNIAVTNGAGVGGNPTIDIGSAVNFSGKTTSPVQVGTMAAIPSACAAGQLYFASDGVPGRQIQSCSATNTWTTQAYAQGTSLPATCSVGQMFFNTGAAVGLNLYLCSGANSWTQMTGAINSVFGRTGAVTSQTGDYTYAQIANTPSALPPNGSAFGDLSGSYPNPVVSQVNGAAIPVSGVLKGNASHQIVSAVSGTDYAPATGSTAVLKGNGSGGFSSVGALDIVGLFSGCSGTQYLGADGACHTSSGGSGGSGYVSLATGAGAPAINCSAPSSSNLALYLDTTNNDEWWCYATNSWKKTLSVTGSGPYVATGATGSAPSTPATGTVACYFDSTLNTQVCLDSSGNSWQMVKESTVADVQNRSCDISVGDTSSSNVVTNMQLGPQKHSCKIPSAATVLEVDIEADTGSPSVIVGRRRCTIWTAGTCSTETLVNLVSAAVAASSGFPGCSNAVGTAGVDGGTTCAASLQNTGLNAGDWIELVSGTAGGVARLVTIHVIYSVN